MKLNEGAILASELKKSFESKKYRFFENGDFNLNIIFVRESDKFTNQFTDRMVLVWKELGLWRHLSIPASTKAGWYGGIFNPITVCGKTGTAVIVPDQYPKCWKFIDNYWQWLAYPYFQQVGPISIWRDYNKDLLIDKIQLQTGLFGINMHRGGNIGYYGRVINYFSQGCLTAEEPEYKKTLPIIRESVKRYGNLFTFTILEMKDLNETSKNIIFKL